MSMYMQACIHVSTAVVLWQQALVKLNRELFWGPLLWCLSLPNLDIGECLGTSCVCENMCTRVYVRDNEG